MSEDQFSALWNPLVLTLAAVGLLSLFPEGRMVTKPAACIIEKTAYRLDMEGKPQAVKIEWVGERRQLARSQ